MYAMIATCLDIAFVVGHQGKDGFYEGYLSWQFEDLKLSTLQINEYIAK